MRNPDTIARRPNGEFDNDASHPEPGGTLTRAVQAAPADGSAEWFDNHYATIEQTVLASHPDATGWHLENDTNSEDGEYDRRVNVSLPTGATVSVDTFGTPGLEAVLSLSDYDIDHARQFDDTHGRRVVEQQQSPNPYDRDQSDGEPIGGYHDEPVEDNGDDPVLASMWAEVARQQEKWQGQPKNLALRDRVTIDNAPESGVHEVVSMTERIVAVIDSSGQHRLIPKDDVTRVGDKSSAPASGPQRPAALGDHGIFTAPTGSITDYDAAARDTLLTSLTPRDTSSDGQYQNFMGANYQSEWESSADISKKIRAELKEAVRFGALPRDAKFRVRSDSYSGGQSVTVEIRNLPDSDTMKSGLSQFDSRTVTHSDAGRELSSVVQKMVDSHNKTTTDWQTDYYSNRFHGSVNVQTEESRDWDEVHKEKQKTQAAWLKGGREKGAAFATTPEGVALKARNTYLNSQQAERDAQRAIRVAADDAYNRLTGPR